MAVLAWLFFGRGRLCSCSVLICVRWCYIFVVVTFVVVCLLFRFKAAIQFGLTVVVIPGGVSIVLHNGLSFCWPAQPMEMWRLAKGGDRMQKTQQQQKQQDRRI